jgi:RNA polymerase sigma-54 factor
MALRPYLAQSLGQEMQLLPRMLQSIQLLQLPAQELEGWLRKEAEQNEALDVDSPRVARDQAQPAENAEQEPERGYSQRLERRGTREDSQRRDEWLQSRPAPEAGAHERLEEQLALLDADPARIAWVRFLIGCIDASGYLSLDDAQLLALAAEQGLTGGADELQGALSLLRSLEPRGIGARNAIEALLLQLEPDEPHYAELRRMLLELLDDLARNRLPSVARSLGISLEQLDELIARLRQLDPRPASQLVESTAPPLVPDVVVERTADGFEVRVDASDCPAARIDPQVVALSRDRSQPKEVRSYLRGKIERARWIVDGLEQRGRTLMRIAQSLFERQKAFLVDGPGHLVPLRMNELADELQVHTSTISRAVAGKYVATPWGCFPLRHFFQACGGADEHTARDGVRDAVRELFASEDGHAPLSDDEVVARMRAKGFELARRTVAKYRAELGIPSSYRRRKFST